MIGRHLLTLKRMYMSMSVEMTSGLTETFTSVKEQKDKNENDI